MLFQTAELDQKSNTTVGTGLRSLEAFQPFGCENIGKSARTFPAAYYNLWVYMLIVMELQPGVIDLHQPAVFMYGLFLPAASF
jgi:hypothetical protein